jgi:hypothetical protein
MLKKFLQKLLDATRDNTRYCLVCEERLPAYHFDGMFAGQPFRDTVHVNCRGRERK